MRVLAVSIWVFINLTIFGLFAYVYILWTQYWKMTAAPKFHYNNLRNNNVRWLLPQLSASWLGTLTNPHGKIRHIWDESMEQKDVPTDKLEAKIETYKNQLIVQLRQWQLDSSNVLLSKGKNRYNVYFQGTRPSHYKKSKLVTCAFKNEVEISFLDSNSEPFRSHGLAQYFPPPLEGIKAEFNTCALVSSSGSLYKSRLGKEIDSHDAVLRFNNAPVTEFENDVGRKTTFRIINSQVISKPRFHFLSSPLYDNITLFVWDPANYTVDMENWFKHPEFNIFEPYFKKRRQSPNQQFFIFHPQFIWDVWDFIQRNTPVPLLRNPPSSGFLGIAYLLHRCNWVDLYEYIPSMRLTKRCHYYDVLDDLGCTFGDWHPLASEKLLTLAMHAGSDADVFHGGFIRLQGLPNIQCP